MRELDVSAKKKLDGVEVGTHSLFGSFHLPPRPRSFLFRARARIFLFVSIEEQRGCGQPSCSSQGTVCTLVLP